MNSLSNLLFVLRKCLELFDNFKAWQKREKLKNAADSTIENRDQRYIESAINGIDDSSPDRLQKHNENK